MKRRDNLLYTNSTMTVQQGQL